MFFDVDVYIIWTQNQDERTAPWGDVAVFLNIQVPRSFSGPR